MGMDLRQNADGSLSILDDSGQGKGSQILRADTDATAGARVLVTKTNSLARSDTVAKSLFTLPKNAVPVELYYFAGTASNAGTAATISVGKSGGSGNEYLNAGDVKTTATGQGQVRPNAATNFFAAASTTADTIITGIYAESGAASSTGGPWNVVMSYYVP